MTEQTRINYVTPHMEPSAFATEMIKFVSQVNGSPYIDVDLGGLAKFIAIRDAKFEAEFKTKKDALQFQLDRALDELKYHKLVTKNMKAVPEQGASFFWVGSL